MCTYQFNVLFEGEHIGVVPIKRLPLVVGCIAEHAKGIHVTLLIAGLGEDVLQSNEGLVCRGNNCPTHEMQRLPGRRDLVHFV